MSLSTLFPVGCHRVYSPGATLDFRDDIGPSFSISSSSSISSISSSSSSKSLQLTKLWTLIQHIRRVYAYGTYKEN